MLLLYNSIQRRCKLTLLHTGTPSVRSCRTSVSKMTFSRGRLLFHVLGSCTRLINRHVSRKREWKLCHIRQWILWWRLVASGKEALGRTELFFCSIFYFVFHQFRSLLKWVNLGRKGRTDSRRRYKYFSITVRFVVGYESNFYTQGQPLLLLLSQLLLL